MKEFSQSFAFFNILFGAPLSVPVTEVVAACLRQMAESHEDPHTFLVSAGKELTILLGGDLNRLKAILERIRK